tara:strand:- start:1884 stop:2276 length:393 start_codon:yes stop_codon:yes gene_type:complete
MAISPPNYQKDAIPTPRGWTHPRTGELLKAQKLSEQQIGEYLGETITSAPPEPIEITINPVSLTESPTTEEEFIDEVMIELDEDEYWTEDDLDGMNKEELEELGREYGIELDRRKTKSVLIAELKEVMFE